MIGLLSLALLAMTGFASATVPTFTWQVMNSFYAGMTPIAFQNALYYWSVQISSVEGVDSKGDYYDYFIWAPGAIPLDEGLVFLSIPPAECNIGTDKTMLCIDSSNNLWYNPDAGYEFSSLASSDAVVPIVGSSSWVMYIDSSGYPHIRSGSGWFTVYTNCIVVNADVGNDGTFVYMCQGSGTPYGCRLSSDGGLSDCVGPLGGTGASCYGVQVLNAKNILCWNQWGLYWLNGGYPSGGWSEVTSLPEPFNTNAYLPSSPTAVLTRPSIGGENDSGNAYFGYYDNNGVFRGAYFAQQS